MKKILVLLLITFGLFLTACGEPKPKVSAEEMLKKYTTAVINADREGVLSTLPEFLREVFGERYTQEFLDEYLKTLKATYGEDVTGSAVVKEESKPTDKELDSIKNYLSEFKDYKEPDRCIVLDGYFDLKGSITEEQLDFAKSIAYCSFDGEWGLIFA